VLDLAPFLLSIIVLILLIYYIFAIIGMKFFHMKVYPGCCEDAFYDVGQYYQDNITHNSSVYNLDVYYLNSFDNVLRSYGKLLW